MLRACCSPHTSFLWEECCLAAFTHGVHHQSGRLHADPDLNIHCVKRAAQERHAVPASAWRHRPLDAALRRHGHGRACCQQLRIHGAAVAADLLHHERQGRVHFRHQVQHQGVCGGGCWARGFVVFYDAVAALACLASVMQKAFRYVVMFCKCSRSFAIMACGMACPSRSKEGR